MASRQGKPEEELFLQRPSNGEDSPTVEPLRISKPMSPKPRADSAASGRTKYQPPSSSKVTFPLPPGASSSANPLPYPDDEDTYDYTRPSEPRTQRAPYPEDPKPVPDRSGSGGASKEQGRPATARRGTNDTTPRLTSPVDKRGPGLAERRGTAPKPLPDSPGPDLPDKDLPTKASKRDPRPSGARRPSHHIPSSVNNIIHLLFQHPSPMGWLEIILI
jgi:hypothetical protein